MNNTYFKYKSLTELFRKYAEVWEMLEENGGEETEEIAIKLQELEDDGEELGWDVLQMIDALESEIEENKKRKDNLDKKNKTLANSVSYLETFMKSLINKSGTPNKSGNKAKKFGERNITVKRSINYEVTENFDDKRFIRYSLKGKYPEAYAKRMAEYAEKYGMSAELDKVILKKELNDFIKESDVLPEGVNQVKKESLLKN